MPVGFITHPDCARHDMGRGHPETPARLLAIERALSAAGLLSRLVCLQAPVATDAQIERAHSEAHLENVQAAAPAQGLVYLDPDTAMNPWTLSASLHAAGAGVLAVDQVLGGPLDSAFCSVRPPGHHACRDRAMGFCLFNNIAIAAAHALEAHGLERVAIIDFDVHHGNGTEDIFAGDPRVLMAGSFQHPYYPGSGADPMGDNMHNVPLPAGAGSAAFRAAVEQVWLPALDEFAPQLLLISAGFDAHRDDGLGALQFADEDYAWVTRQIKAVADTHAGGRIVSMLEGGYDLVALGRCVTRHVSVLLGNPPD
jgi:acetoin utilization deacetylase AcuC-like enzyme